MRGEYGYNNSLYQRREYKHGADTQILLDGNKIYHRKYGNETLPVVRSYPEGLRVGCTFISNEALERLFKFNQEYLNRKDIVEHQSGV